MSKLFNLVLLTLFLILFVQAGKHSKKSHEKGKSKTLINKKQNQADCYDDIDSPYVFFGTKTSYRWNRNKNDDEVTPPGCVAQQFWLFARHGSRNPTTKDMIKLKSVLPLIQREIVSNYKAGRGSLCKDDIKNLEKWKFHADVDDGELLVKEGFKELKGIGDRFQHRFRTLLTRPFVNSSYIFQHTDTERTNASARAFAKGMFGKKNIGDVFFQKSSTPDTLLRFDEVCDKWKKKVHANSDALIERTLFEESDDFLSMLQSVTHRLGFFSTLNFSDINLMYNMCLFNKAWHPKKLSPWCAVFSKDDLKILEYREDLEFYYENGYGFPINYEQACVPLKDVHDSFRRVVDNISPNPKGKFYFTHTGTVLKVMARFGLFKDAIPVKHSNRELMKHREWRTSLISSFGTHLALVLFNCTDGHYVTAYVQERPIKLPGCTNELCKFSDFTAQYELFATSCDVEGTCRI
ncbi:hypothetical protein OUZ56_026848 [Daphnia magna]|uniref:Multiple inositol polyphosphate phosphatase 1 n=1 Tax=Daphnia magna TaxID=35525 RepID=A0ABQ9ZN16_9CRUS|nr:hypothetical protein OUZ56_026848 [Daphnia magna]